MTLLQSSLDTARSGRSLITLMVGEPGIGKTRLVNEAGQTRSRSRPGRQIPHRPGGLRRAHPRWLLRLGVAVADQLADRARTARRRQPRGADRDVPSGLARLPALRRRRASGDGVHLAERTSVQHHPRHDGVGGRNLDARTVFFYLATVNTPAMALHIPVWVRNTRTPSTTARASTSTAAGTTPSPSHPESRPKTSGRSSSTTPRPDRNSRPGNRSRARTTRASRSLPTLTARSPSPSDRPSLTRNPATGSRPFPARSGSPSCGSTDRWNPGSTRPGFLARSNRSTLNSERNHHRVERPEGQGGNRAPAHPAEA